LARTDSDAVSRTTRGLGGGAKRTSSETSAGAEQRWVALLKQGLVDLDGVPELVGRETGDGPRDEVESFVIARIETGATLRTLVSSGAHPEGDVLRAVARLAHRELLRLT
jgi:hypothetical protein